MIDSHMVISCLTIHLKQVKTCGAGLFTHKAAQGHLLFLAVVDVEQFFLEYQHSHNINWVGLITHVTLSSTFRIASENSLSKYNRHKKCFIQK